MNILSWIIVFFAGVSNMFRQFQHDDPIKEQIKVRSNLYGLIQKPSKNHRDVPLAEVADAYLPSYDGTKDLVIVHIASLSCTYTYSMHRTVYIPCAHNT